MLTKKSYTSSNRKKGKKKPILFIFALLIAFYCFMWLYTAWNIESSASNLINSFNKDAKSSPAYEGNISFDSISVSGFPLNFALEIEKPVFDIRFKDVSGGSSPGSYNIKTEEKFVMEIGVFDKKTSFILPKLMSMVYTHPNSSKVNNFDFSYTSTPVMELEMKNSPFEHFITSLNGNPWLSDRFAADDFVSFAYKDNGSSMIEAGNNKVMSSGGYIFSVSNKPLGEGKNEFHFQTKGENIVLTDKYYEIFYSDAKKIGDKETSLLDLIIEQNKKSGSFAYNVDFTYTGSLDASKRVEDYDFVLKQFAFVNDIFAINSDGQITMDAKSDKLPFGWLRLSMRNYQDMQRYFAQYYNFAMDGIAAQNPNKNIQAKLTNEDIASFNNFLAKVASIYNDGKDMMLVMKREKGGDAYIGNIPLAQAFGMLNEEMAKNTQPVPDAGAVVPNAKDSGNKTKTPEQKPAKAEPAATKPEVN